MNPPTVYFTNSLPGPVLVVGALGAVLVLVVGCCGALNALTRRRRFNGWLWGALTVVFLLSYHLISVYTAEREPVLESAEPAGEIFATTIGVALLLALATWRAIAWQRRSRP
jgi:hypothetical protein